MEATPQPADLFNAQPPQSGTLKTLTTLTFVGCGLSYLSFLFNITSWGSYEKQLADAERMQDKMLDNEMIAKISEGSIEMIKRSHEYRYIILASGLLFTTLCLIGALRMRKLQKSGYPLYVIGEIAPLIVTSVLLGFTLLGGVITIITAIVTLLFVILYTNQRKYLIY